MFGEIWTAARRRLSDQINRQYELAKLDRSELLVRPLLTALNQWEEPVSQLDDLRTNFERSLGELYSRLRETLARSDGMLTLFELHRDYIAEQQRTDGREEPIMSHREVPFARVIGLSWLRTFDAPRHLLDATRVVRRYWALLGNSDGHSTAQMSKVRRELEEAFEDLEQISDLHVQSDQFFTSDNLTKIVAWTQKASHVRGHYQLIAGGIAP